MVGNLIIDKDINTILSENIDWDYLSGKTVLITGASGFIPSYIVYTLLELNTTKFSNNPMIVLAVVRNKKKALKKFDKLISREDFDLIVSDVTEPINFDKKIDIIIHAASHASPKYYGTDPVGTLKANTIGTANMLELARRNNAKKFIYISSGEVYGMLDDGQNTITESYTGNVDITDVRSCYAESKRAGENMCVCWSYQYGFHVNMLRLSHTYGPGVELDDGRVFADFVKNIINNENIVLNSDGKAKRSFVYISDMITGLFRILFYGEDRGAYNIAADRETEIFELANTLCGLYPDKNLSVKFNNITVSTGYIRSKSTGAALSTEKLKQLGWKQKVSLEQGFRRMIESYYI
jgi:nucleoside-diphosphate-sugar epimerase